MSKGWDADRVTGLTQTSNAVGKLGVIPGMVEAVFKLTRESAATQPAQTQNGKRANPTTILARDESLKVYVVELSEYTPVSPALFAADRFQMVERSLDDERAQFAYAWLAPAALMERMHFVPAMAPKKDDKGDEE
jgi:hypothetical protein